MKNKQDDKDVAPRYRTGLKSHPRGSSLRLYLRCAIILFMIKIVLLGPEIPPKSHTKTTLKKNFVLHS